MSEEPDLITWKEFSRDRRSRGQSLKDASKDWRKVKESPVYQLEKAVRRAFRKEKIPDPVPNYRDRPESSDFQLSDERRPSQRDREREKYSDYYET